MKTDGMLEEHMMRGMSPEECSAVTMGMCAAIERRRLLQVVDNGKLSTILCRECWNMNEYRVKII